MINAMNKTFRKRLEKLEYAQQQRLERSNEMEKDGNGIYDRYKNPVLTAADVPLSWRYDLDPETKKQIDRGQRITELLKQPQYQPYAVEDQVAAIYAVNNGYMDKVPRNKVVDFEAALQGYAATAHKAALDAINASPVLKEHEAKLKAICEDFAKTGSY